MCSVYDPVDEEIRMKGNHNTMIYRHADLWIEAAPNSKETCQLTDENLFIPFIEFERDAAQWSPLVTSFSISNQSNINEDSGSIEEHKVDRITESTTCAVINDAPDSIDYSKGKGDCIPNDNCELGLVSSADSKKCAESQQGSSFGIVSLISGDSVQKDEPEPNFDAPGNEENETRSSIEDVTTSSLDNEATKPTQLSSQIDLEDEKTKEVEEHNVPTDLHVQKQEHEISYEDTGERSFSEVSLVMYSGPIADSGSLSIRSDGSISGRSFAFPILRSEWNSSPVRMAKADRRNFRKQRGWGSGFLCCRF